MILRLASILALSSVRAKRGESKVPKGLSKSPLTNIIFTVIGFPVIALLVYKFSYMLGGSLPIRTLFLQSSIFLPSLMVTASVMYSLLFEFSHSYPASTDMINWLPVTAAEYVLASALSIIYFLAPILTLFLGFSLGVAIAINKLDIWAFSSLMVILGTLVGVFITEIMRVLTNRLTSTFYRRGGRSALATRMVVTILLMVFFILIFNVNVLIRVLRWFFGEVSSVWFLPFVWQSMAVMNYLMHNQQQTVIYVASSIFFALLLLLTSVKMRARYWVPTQVSIQMSSSKNYIPRRNALGRLGFSLAEASIVRKDLKALTRRREMMGWIAIPVAIIVISFITSYPSLASAITIFDKLIFFTSISIGAYILAFYLSLIGIGQEGESFINLLSIPLKERELVKAKLVASFLPATIALISILILTQILVQPDLEIILLFAISGFSILAECCFIGLAVGSRYPDFTEAPRARFIRPKGVLYGMLILGIAILITLTPIIFINFIVRETVNRLYVSPLTLLISTLICSLSYRLTIKNIEKLFTQNL